MNGIIGFFFIVSVVCFFLRKKAKRNGKNTKIITWITGFSFGLFILLALVSPENTNTEKKEFVLDASEKGMYGVEKTLNKDKIDDDGYNFEYSFFIYQVPQGTYEVYTLKKGAAQLSLCKNETAINEDGMEEMVFLNALVVEESKSGKITVKEDEWIKLSDYSKVKLIKIK